MLSNNLRKGDYCFTQNLQISVHSLLGLVFRSLRCLPGALLILLLPGFFTVILIRLCLAIGLGGSKIRLRALWDALYSLPEIWEERRSIQSRRKIGALQFGRSMTWSLGKLLMRSSDGRSIPKSVRVNSIGKADACSS